MEENINNSADAENAINAAEAEIPAVDTDNMRNKEGGEIPAAGTYNMHNASKAENEENRVELSGEQFEQLLKKERANGRGQGVIITIAVMAIVCIIVAGVYFTTKYIISGEGEPFIDKNVKAKTSTLWNMIESNFLWDEYIDKDYAKEWIYKAILASLDDPYSVYYTKDEYRDLLESFDGQYYGIGAYVSQNAATGEIYISKPMPGSPAEEAGLLPDDRILEVNGEAVDGMDLNVVVSKIKGPEGTTVDIGILREGNSDMITFSVTRRKIEVIMVEGEMLDDNIGYIRIDEVEENVLKQFDEIYSNLKSEGMEGMILDLRDNPGGDLNVVVDLADEFLDKGIVVYTKDKYGKIIEYKSDADCEKIPMVVLVNSNTASAAEILSGSLKERGVATIVGTTTFGKGIVQSVYPLKDGSGLKLTESEYFLEHDTKIHGIGVIPDIEISLDREAYLESGTDNQLDKAIEVMKEKLK